MQCLVGSAMQCLVSGVMYCLVSTFRYKDLVCSNIVSFYFVYTVKMERMSPHPVSSEPATIRLIFRITLQIGR